MRELSLDLFNVVFSIAPFFMFAVFIWMIVATFQHVAPSGRLKRGICIWQETLHKELMQYLRDLQLDVHDENAFIRVEGQERLIRGRQQGSFRWRTSWPYVGYINLKHDEPKLQYRLPLPNLLFLLPFTIGFFIFPFILLVINHVIERGIIIGYLQREAGFLQSKQTKVGLP